MRVTFRDFKIFLVDNQRHIMLQQMTVQPCFMITFPTQEWIIHYITVFAYHLYSQVLWWLQTTCAHPKSVSPLTVTAVTVATTKTSVTSSQSFSQRTSAFVSSPLCFSVLCSAFFSWFQCGSVLCACFHPLLSVSFYPPRDSSSLLFSLSLLPTKYIQLPCFHCYPTALWRNQSNYTRMYAVFPRFSVWALKLQQNSLSIFDKSCCFHTTPFKAFYINSCFEE